MPTPLPLKVSKEWLCFEPVPRSELVRRPAGDGCGSRVHRLLALDVAGEQWQVIHRPRGRVEGTAMESGQTIESGWPQGMSLTIEEFPAPVMQLLYIRYAWRLENWIHVPELDPLPSRGGSALPATLSKDAASQQWEAAWRQNFFWYRRSRPGSEMEAESATGSGSGGPFWWFREYGTEGVDVDAYEAWMRELEPMKTAHLASSPERIAVEAVARAWRQGLRNVYVMPFEDSGGAEWNGARSMTVSARTRLDPNRYPAVFTHQPADGSPDAGLPDVERAS
jgi:hypothetical protein